MPHNRASHYVRGLSRFLYLDLDLHTTAEWKLRKCVKTHDTISCLVYWSSTQHRIWLGLGPAERKARHPNFKDKETISLENLLKPFPTWIEDNKMLRCS